MKEGITFDKYDTPGGRELLIMHANNPGLEIIFYFHRKNWQRSRPFASIPSFLFFSKQIMVLSGTLGNA
jgi:hypothetical protein